MRTFLSAVALCAVLAPAARADEPVSPWKAGKAGVSLENLAMPLTDEEYYSDRYTAEAWFKDGTRVYVSVLVTNLGPGTGKMTAKTRWYEKSGKEHYAKKELDRGDYKISNSPFSVEAGHIRLSGTPQRFKVTGSVEGYSYDLTFASGLSPWRPGTGRTTFGATGEKYFDTTLVQPRAVVTGSVTQGGQRTALDGYGYVLHTFGNMAPHAMYKRFLELRSIDGDTVVYLKQFTTPAEYGGKTVGFLYVARDGKPLVTSTGFGLKLGRVQTDGAHANKYKVPLELSTTVKRGDTTIDIVVSAPKIAGREDVLAGMSGLERTLVAPYAQPVNYSMDAEITVSVKQGDAEPVVSKEKASYGVSHLNK